MSLLRIRATSGTHDKNRFGSNTTTSSTPSSCCSPRRDGTPATGELPSPRWRFAAWASAATLVAGVVPVLFGPGVIDEDVDGSPLNPIGILAAGIAILVGMFLLDSPLQAIFGVVYGVIGAVVAISAIRAAVGIALLRRT